MSETATQKSRTTKTADKTDAKTVQTQDQPKASAPTASAASDIPAASPTGGTASPLFYGAPAPLDRERHKDMRLDRDKGLHFAGTAQFIPALHEEFAEACRSLPVLFLPGAGAPAPVFLCGMEAGENRFVDTEGVWTGAYVPAYLRRYPFILGEVENEDAIICIDEGAAVLSRETGERLFTDDAKETETLTNAIALTNEYFAASKRTEALVSQITALGLLQPIAVQTRDAAGAARSIQGLLAVDERRLAELSDEDFLALRRTGALPALYAHLMSLAQIERLQPGDAKAAA